MTIDRGGALIELCERPIALLTSDRSRSAASSARDSVSLLHRLGGATQIRPMTKPFSDFSENARKQLGPNLVR
jgi:hypothetical protein